MKILIVGDNLWDIYEKSFYKGFKELGYDVDIFGYGDRFKNSLLHKIEKKFAIGIVTIKINQDLLNKVQDYKPDLIFFYRVLHIYPKTYRKIKQNFDAKLFCYNNDDPFATYYPSYYWRHYKNSLKYMDWIFSYRWKNIEDYKNLGFTNSSILRSYYLKEKNFYIENIIDSKYKSDVVFLGHWEDDGRDEYIKLLFDNDIDIKLYGHSWQNSKYYEFFKEKLDYEIKVVSKDYNLAINSAKIALVFLSKLNNDTYTRRCFEIPATSTLMISEYTDDSNNMFKEGVDAEYFRDKKELLEKVQFYLNEKERLHIVSTNGYERLMKDGHEVVDRCKEIVKVYDEE